MTDAELLYYAGTLGFVREPTLVLDGQTPQEAYGHYEGVDAEEAREYLAAGCRYWWEVEAQK